MNIATIVIVLVGLMGIALSVKSVAVLGRDAPWTSAGWLATALYLSAAIVKATVAPTLPSAAEYAVLVALTAAFVVAGIRDERQAEPWWWPSRRGTTRAEKRGAN
jgi:hypothetical protein